MSEFSPVLQFQVLFKLSTNTNKFANYMLPSTGRRTCFINVAEFTVVKEMKKLYGMAFVSARSRLAKAVAVQK